MADEGQKFFKFVPPSYQKKPEGFNEEKVYTVATDPPKENAPLD